MINKKWKLLYVFFYQNLNCVVNNSRMYPMARRSVDWRNINSTFSYYKRSQHQIIVLLYLESMHYATRRFPKGHTWCFWIWTQTTQLQFFIPGFVQMNIFSTATMRGIHKMHLCFKNGEIKYWNSFLLEFRTLLPHYIHLYENGGGAVAWI